MQVAIVGLGRMGNNVALHLLAQGVSVIAYNRTREKTDALVHQGATGAYTLAEIPQKFSEKPIVVILFVTAGAVTEEFLFGAIGVEGSREKDAPREIVQPGLVDVLPQGSIIIDAGNSFFKDSQRRGQIISARGLHFLDMGTSGGLDGARTGACLMVGGEEVVYTQVEPLLKKMAAAGGYGYVGPRGAGHFVKMVHNGIEYGMMGAIAEGLNIVERGKGKGESFSFEIDLVGLTGIWKHGSIVSGLLMEKMHAALAKDPQLEGVSGEVPRGETEAEMEWLGKTGIPNPVIQASREERVATRQNPSFVGKLIALLRREFGGHAIK